MDGTAPDFVTAEAFARQFQPLMEAPVPAEDHAHLMRLVADTIAIAAYARSERIGACGVDETGPAIAGPAEIWGTGTHTDPESAAMLNGTAAEALDFQEVFIDGRNNGHAAVVIVPALVALDAANPSADRLLRALRVAFAANAMLARALGRGHRAGEVGFRTTSLTAPIAAALAGGYLLAGPVQAGHACAISAATLPAGLLAAMAPGAGSFSVDKDLSVGLSARHAVTCARLAANGATGPRSALDGPRSWLASFGFDTADATYLVGDAAGVDLTRYALKLFPANYGCQCAIRLALDLGRDLDPDAITGLAVHVKSSSAASLSTRTINTHVAARFSVAYAVASALYRHRSELADFEGAALNDARVLAFMDRVRVESDDAYQHLHETQGIFPCRMEITLADGTVIRGERMTPYDNAEPETLDTALADKIDSLCSGEQAARLHALARTGGLQTVHEIFSK